MSAVLSTDEVARTTGISHRQLDYGYRRGVLLPSGGRGGSGTRLGWGAREVAVIRRLAEVASGLPFVEFGELARCHAAALREGQTVVVDRKWGQFRIDPPATADEEHTDDDATELSIVIVDRGAGVFGVECGCGWSTENPHSQSSAHDIALGHNKGTHRHRGVIKSQVGAA